MRRLPAGRDDGQITLLVLGFVAILLLLLTLVTDASKIFLAQRSLSGAADAAALAGANAVDEGTIYAGRTGTDLPLTDDGVRAAVRDYVVKAGLDDPDRFRDFAVLRAGTDDGVTATVTLHTRVRLPFVRLLSRRWSGGYPVQVTAHARSPLTR